MAKQFRIVRTVNGRPTGMAPMDGDRLRSLPSLEPYKTEIAEFILKAERGAVLEREWIIVICIQGSEDIDIQTEALDALQKLYIETGAVWIADLLHRAGRETDWCKLAGHADGCGHDDIQDLDIEA